jgi:hypothetical protein
VTALARAAAAAGRELRILVQVSLDPPSRGGAAAGAGAPGNPGARGPAARGGAAPADVLRIADFVASSPPLRLAGLMAVAPPDQPPRQAFSELRELSARLRDQHPAADAISAGMSADLEAAVAEGATHLRIGAALFGRRLIVP